MDSNEPTPLKKRKLDEQLNLTESNGQLFQGKHLRCLDRVFLSKGDYGSIYHGLWKENSGSEEKEVAVRRVKVTDCQETWKDIVDKHLSGKLNNDNVLKIICVEEDAQSRYFALELYAATLEQFCTGQYTGPMPSEAQVLNQIVSGVNYLHDIGLAHGNLNPQTVLISQAQPVRIKVAEFGLCKYYDGEENDAKSHQLPSEELLTSNIMTDDSELNGDEGRESNNCSNDQGEQKLNRVISSHPKYWTRAKYESLPVDQEGKRSMPRGTVNGDIFATGCLCFYYLKRGLHPFGDFNLILFNISKMKHVNLRELAKEHYAFKWIKNLIGSPPRDGHNYLRNFVSYFKNDFSLKIDEKAELGRGGFGIVFAGTFDGKKVAVKRITVADADPDAIKREVKEHNRLDHDNVLKLLHVDEEKDPDFKYLVLELCAGTLTDYCDPNKSNKYKGPKLPSDAVVLFQIALGLDYIHSKNLVHRDIKPDNILISMTSPVQMKLSDFGYCKKVSPQGTFTQSGLKGTLNWMAPELLEILIVSNPDTIPDVLPRGTIESDTFAAGCVFFYFLTRGSHPFGSPSLVPANICSHFPILLNDAQLLQADEFGHAMLALVGGMIKKLDERTKLKEVFQELAPFLPQPSTVKFMKVTKTLPTTSSSSYICSRFHPTDPVLACGLDDGQVIFFEATGGLLPFSYWRENKVKFTHDVIGKKVTALEWNVNGTQLAAGFVDGTVIAWSYPSGHVLFQMKKHSKTVWLIAWNPFRKDIFATRQFWSAAKKLLLWNTQENGDAGNANHFLTMERDVDIDGVAWISENQVALGLGNGRIEICQIDDIKQETTSTERIIKRFEHGEGGSMHDLQWNETTGYLAACIGDKWIKIWSMDSDQPVYSLEADSGCYSLTWRRKGKTWSSEGGIEAARKSKENLEIVCGLRDGSIVSWNPLEEDEAKRKRILPQKHSKWVVSLSFSPDGRFLASADYNKEIIIWSTETWESVYSCENAGYNNLSWMSLDSSSSFPVYKLTGRSRNKEVCVIEQAVTE